MAVFLKTALILVLLQLVQIAEANADRCDLKLSGYDHVRELGEAEYRHASRRAGNQALLGRFFEVRRSNKPGGSLMWLIPFANSGACVVRESIAIRRLSS